MSRNRRKNPLEGIVIPEGQTLDEVLVARHFQKMADRGLMPYPRRTEEERRIDDARQAEREKRLGLGPISPELCHFWDLSRAAVFALHDEHKRNGLPPPDQEQIHARLLKLSREYAAELRQKRKSESGGRSSRRRKQRDDDVTTVTE